jgi:hypothetical protein
MKDTSKTNHAPRKVLSTADSQRKEVRCAVRFPLSLQAVLSDEHEHGESSATTLNV